jgi:hypothetical protein
VDRGSAKQTITCLACERQWDDVYQLLTATDDSYDNKEEENDGEKENNPG